LNPFSIFGEFLQGKTDGFGIAVQSSRFEVKEGKKSFEILFGVSG
jgi:hypothetical protein